MRAAVRLVLLALAAAVTAFVAGSTPATAGGPTSVIIVNPATGAAAALYATDADYVALQEALDLAPSGGSHDPGPRLSAGPGTSAINVTWLVHDVNVWRVDRVRTDIKGVAGPGSAAAAAADEVAVDEKAVDEKESSTTSERDTALAVAGSDGPFAGWWWALAGVIIGFGLASLRRPVVTAIRNRGVPSRHQLIDA